MRKKILIETPKSGNISYKISQPNALKSIKKVIPANCLITPYDNIPGIQSGYMPRGNDFVHMLDSAKTDNLLMGAAKFYIEGCTISIPSTLEIRILDSFKESYGNQVEVVVGDCRINVAAHNQWCPVNSSKFKNSITLTSEDGLLHCNGSLIVDNVYATEGMALVFILEYTLRLIRKECEDEYKHIYLSDFVHVLNAEADIMGSRKAKLSVKMNTDPMRSVVGDLLWSPPESLFKEKLNISLECEISNKSTISPSKVNAETGISRDLAIPENLENNSVGPIVDATLQTAQRIKDLEERKQKLDERERELSKKPLLNEVDAQTSVNIQSEKPKQSAGFGTESKMPSTPDKLSPQAQGIQEIDIQPDMQDPLKGNSLIFSFENFHSSSKPEISIPPNICFSFKFFTFPTTYTQAVSLRAVKNDRKNLDYSLQLGTEVKKWTNLISRDKEGKCLKLQFDIDPTLDKDTPAEIQTLDFCNYLAYNAMRIWIWNVEGLTPIGSIRLNLFELLRRGSPSVQVKRDLEVFSEDSNEIIGSIQLTIDNIGRLPGEIKRKDVEGTLTISKTPSKGKTKIYSKPLTIEEIGKLAENASKMAPQDEQQKIDTVNSYRLHMSIVAGKRGIPFWLQESLQNDVEKYRALSRSINMSKVLGQMEEENEKYPFVYYTLGQMTLFPILLINSGKNNTSFSLHLDDPDNDVSVVNNPEEWKYFCMQEKYEQPADWNSLIDLNNIPLKGEDHILIILKVFPLNLPKTRERIISLSFKDNSTNDLVFHKEISLKFKETYYNAYYVFNVPEKRVVDMPLIADLPNDVYRYAKSIKCSTNKVECKMYENRISSNYAVGSAPIDSELFVFLYSDEFCYRLLSIIYVIIRPYSCIDLSGIAGKKMEVDLEFINHGVTTQIEIKASNEQILQIDEKSAGILSSEAGSAIKVKLLIGTFKPGKSHALLHCIGIFQKILRNNRF